MAAEQDRAVGFRVDRPLRPAERDAGAADHQRPGAIFIGNPDAETHAADADPGDLTEGLMLEARA